MDFIRPNEWKKEEEPFELNITKAIYIGKSLDQALNRSLMWLCKSWITAKIAKNSVCKKHVLWRLKLMSRKLCVLLSTVNVIFITIFSFLWNLQKMSILQVQIETQLVSIIYIIYFAENLSIVGTVNKSRVQILRFLAILNPSLIVYINTFAKCLSSELTKKWKYWCINFVHVDDLS